MSPLGLCPVSAPIHDTSASNCGSQVRQDVVEIGLLLPAEWAAGLIELSVKRKQSVGQLLRSLVERALREGDSTI